MHDDSAAKHALRPDQLDVFVSHGALSVALAIGLEVAEITNMADAVRWCTVSLIVWVDYIQSAHSLCIVYLVALTVWACAGAAVGIVAKGMNVHATLSIGVMTADFP